MYYYGLCQIKILVTYNNSSGGDGGGGSKTDSDAWIFSSKIFFFHFPLEKSVGSKVHPTRVRNHTFCTALTAGTSSSSGRISGRGPTGVMAKGLICVWLRV